MKRKQNSTPLLVARLFCLFLIMMAFLVLFVFCTFLPRTAHSNYDTLTEKPEFSFGALFDGSYTAQLTDYYSDTVFNRDSFKELYRRISGWFGKETVRVNEQGEQEIDIGDFSIPDESSATSDTTSSSESSFGGESSSGTVSGGTSEGSSDESSDVSSGAPSDDPSVDTSSSPENKQEIEANGIFILGTRAMEIYYGDANLARIPKFAETLNDFATSLPGVKVYSMPIPKACAFYLKNSTDPKKLSQEGNTLRDLAAVENHLSGKVTSVNIYDALKAHANEEIYFRTDHHWSSLGAYYAAQKFASVAGLPFRDLSEYEKNVRPGYLGTMSTYTGQHPVIMNNPEDFVVYKPKANYTATFYNQSFQNGFAHDIFFQFSDEHRSSWYSTFINGDAYAVQIQSDACSNGRKLLLVKDSYGNALIPFLLYSFEEVYVVDARKFQPKLQSFVAEHGITDVLFAESMLSMVGNDYINDLKGLCN